jgi:hypothetical protein
MAPSFGNGREEGVLPFSLFSVFALPKDGAMLRCQINRLNKTDVKEPYSRYFQTHENIIVI